MTQGPWLSDAARTTRRGVGHGIASECRLCFSRPIRRLGRRRGERPSWRAVLSLRTASPIRAFAAQVQGSYLPRYGAALQQQHLLRPTPTPTRASSLECMLDDGTLSRSAGLHVRKMSCCWGVICSAI